MQVGLSCLVGGGCGEIRAAVQLTLRENERGVRVAYVQGRAGVRLGILILGQMGLAHRVLAVFGKSPLGHPAAAGNTEIERDVESRPIGAGLSSGNDFANHRGSPRLCMQRTGRCGSGR